MKRSFVSFLTAGLFSVLFSVSAQAAGWEQTENVWRYTDEEGNILKGWQSIKEENGDKNYWYYFDPETGNMTTGWREIPEENGNASHYYFFDEETGAMWTDSTTPDGSYVNKDGVWLKDGKETEIAEVSVTGEPEESKDGSEAVNATEETEAAVPETENESNEAYASKLVSLLNEKRRSEGLPEFNVDENLKAGAETRAKELTVSYSSLRPDGNKSKYAINGWENYTALVEIKDRSLSPEATIENWFKADSSESLILTNSFSQGGKIFSFTDIGVGCEEKDGELFFAVFLSGHSD